MSSPSPSSQPAPAPSAAGSRHASALLSVLCVPMFLVLLDVLAMNVAMPTLGQRFGVDTRSWAQVVDAYTVPLALGLLPAGHLVDRQGARRCLLGGLWLFLATSTLGGLGWSWPVVLAARAGQGLSAAVMLPAGLAALSQAWPDGASRAHALGTWSGVSALATALGPAVGGLLVQLASWRAVFWVNVPLALLALVGTARLLPPGRPAEQSGPCRSRRHLFASLLAAFMMTSAANGTLQVLTVHLQHGRHLSAGRAGLVLLVATLPFAALGPVSGRLVASRGRRASAAGGLVIGGLGLFTLGHLPGVAGLVPGLLGIGIGLGLMTAAIVGESLAAWPLRPGFASGLNNALRQAGTSAGVAVGGALAGRASGAHLLTTTGMAAGGWWLVAAAVVLLGFDRCRPAA